MEHMKKIVLGSILGICVVGLLVMQQMGYLVQARHLVQKKWADYALKKFITEISFPSDTVTQIVSGIGADIFVLSQQKIVRYNQGNIEATTTLLDETIFQALFHKQMVGLSSILVSQAGDVWVGTEAGSLYFWDGQWHDCFSSLGKKRPYEPISQIIAANGLVYFITDQVWQWNKLSQQLERLPQFKNSQAVFLENTPDGNLWIATTQRLWQKKPSADWQAFWVFDQPLTIRALHLNRLNDYWVGTSRGIFSLDPQGKVQNRLLADKSINAIIEEKLGNLWVSTDNDGLHYNKNKVWEQFGFNNGLRTNQISALHLDRSNRMWVGERSFGIQVLTTNHFDAIKSSAIFFKRNFNASLYNNACIAGKTRLGKSVKSGDIATELVAGQVVTFFSGQQICPVGIGYRIKKGKTIRLVEEQKQLISWENGRATAIPPLPGRQNAFISVLFVDHQENIWAGTRQSTVYQYKNGMWQQELGKLEMGNSVVTTLAQDHQGTIWVGAWPQSPNHLKRGKHAGLFFRVANQWSAYLKVRRKMYAGIAKKNAYLGGIGSSRVNDIQPIDNGQTAIATEGGMSIVTGTDEFLFTTVQNPGLASDSIVKLATSAGPVIWIGHSDYGLSWYNGTSFQNVNSRNGFFTDHIKALALDGEENIWVLARSGQVGIYPRSDF